MGQRNNELTNSQKLLVRKMKSQKKYDYSMMVAKHEYSVEYGNGFSFAADNPKSRNDVSKIQSKIGRYLKKYKSKMQETKKFIRLEKLNPIPVKNYSSQKLNRSGSQKKKNMDTQSQDQTIQSRQKGCYILEKGRLKLKNDQYFEKDAKIDHPKGQNCQYNKQAQEAYFTSQKPVIHPALKNINEYSDSVSTNSSRGSIKQPRLTDFLLGKKIGQGKYGQVYIAKHKTSGITVALKKMFRKSIDFYAQKQLAQQIKIQFFINHPNVIKLYCFFNDGQHIYLVMQLFTSGNLFSYLQKKGKVQEKTTRMIAQQICQGINHLHLNNIIHRDVKLQNILYQMGMIKLCDFGWSIETEDYRQTFCGTPLYLSPELLQQKGYDNKIDIWSLGVLTFELLYGRVPFEIKSQLDFSKIIYNQVKFPNDSSVSKQAKQFITACLIKDPASRPSASKLLKYKFLTQVQSYPGSQIY